MLKAGHCCAVLGFFVLAAQVAIGCHKYSLHDGPLARADSGGPPVAIFHIDWRRELVAPKIWEYAPREYATPAVDPDTGRILALTRDGWVRCLNPEGKEEWTFETKGAFNAGAKVKEGIAYVPGGDGFLYALNSRTGKLVWSYDSKEELATVPVVSAGKVLVASSSNTLYAVEAATGKWLWQHRRDQPSGFTVHGASAPTVSFGVVYAGFSDGTLVALNLEDGTVKWERGLGAAGGQFYDVDTSPVVDDSGRVYAASYKDGIYALDAESGSISWHQEKTGIRALAKRGEVLFAAGEDQLGAMLGESGYPIWAAPVRSRASAWTSKLDARAAATPVYARGLLAVATEAALLFVDSASGETRLTWDPGAGVSAPPAWAQPRLYVLSNQGSLYALRLVGTGG